MNKAFKLMVLGFSAAILAACGSSDNGPAVAKVAAADTTTLASASTTTGFVNTPFSFPAGSIALGTTGPTTVKFTSAGAAPGFEIANFGVGTATGTTAFGSCIFNVASSSFPATHPLGAGKTVRVDPCTFKIKTKGLKADGGHNQRGADLSLGQNDSDDAPVDVQVDGDGNVKVNGNDDGKTQTSDVTGASS